MTTPISGGRLRGQTALVTGGSRGIGAAVARSFVAEGAAVAVAHEPTPAMAEAAEQLVAELRAAGGTAVAVPGDLATPDGPGQVVADARAALGPLSTVVANAAASGRSPYHELTVEQWDLVQAVNTRGTWLLAKAARDDLVATGGSIINLTSVMVRTGQPWAVHYTASKAAILGMTRALARELGPHGVRVNAVMPGAIRTENEVELDPDADKVAAEILPLQSLQRRGMAEDLAGAFVFLASPEASFITGQVINVDGGWVMY
ncbi:SDR family NAD(P)-dependent oxidoreductase [Nocardioides marmotae]|uniref:SDR family oxidoreductase n=1 Tax=Nocardioides marmotae TaxID=2663857 RepID=A0A6I3J9E7_9ACTN|nr:SDR family oxidoreductase [Nocardioides marmotae]MCR6030736.1 SDR family oxidoreductase [Gordonia jinghuaiqii]MBC9733999.1 SDR family oxidoreductase [Nocardioides marmotae]MTB85102.1 SDR family oxidoreductase [Nocardioides marmotae]MTB94370.1 SDR family oxidoreductase [Nocardioides marmotae]QKE01604.1 SDR family oxidoreductase [Nocardioides marmotae]